MRATDDNLLRRSSLFQFLPEEPFEKLRPLLQEESYEFGDILVRQGDPADSFYILVSGRARVIKTDQNGEEIVLATLKPGQYPIAAAFASSTAPSRSDPNAITIRSSPARLREARSVLRTAN